MPAEHAEGLDDIMMGSVSEGVSESDEVFAERVRQTQAKIKQIKKDEKKSHNFDDKLAKIIPKLSPLLLDIVVFLIDFEMPSLTVLSIISIVENDSGKICWKEFSQYIAEKADFSDAHLPEKTEEKISYWWTFIYGADHVAVSTKLKELKSDTTFVKKFSHYLGQLLVTFLQQEKIQEFNEVQLKKILQKYQMGLFNG